MAAIWKLAVRLASLDFFAHGQRSIAFFMFGILAGLGVFLIHISRAASYLSDAPETCMNCHVMATQYVTWQHGSHANAATCNDCHVPHTSLAAQYGFKAKDGLWHATVFTMRWEPQAIRLSKGAVSVVENNCRRCHDALVADTAAASHQPGDLRCWDCHRETPHGSVRSLSAVPDVFEPRLPPISKLRQQPRIGGRKIEP